MRIRRTFASPSALRRLPLVAGLAGCLMTGVPPAQAATDAVPKAYVSNQAGDISVIDLTTFEPAGQIDAYGKEPRGIGLTADGALLVTANRDDGNISVIDRVSGQLLRHVKIGANPEFVRVRGRMAFVSFEPSSTGGPPPKEGSPEAAAAAKAKEAAKKDDDDKKDEPARIAVVDLDKGTVLRTITGGLETEGIEFSADGKRILVTNEEDETVTVHDIATGKLVKTVSTKPYGERPRGIKMAPDGKSYIATLEHGNAFVVLDGSYNVVKKVATGDSPYGVAFDSKGERLYIAVAKSKALQVFDAKTYELVKSVTTGERCWHFSFTPDEQKILVACGRSHEVVVIDVATLEPTKHIEDGKLPWGVVVYPKTVGSLDGGK